MHYRNVMFFVEKFEAKHNELLLLSVWSPKIDRGNKLQYTVVFSKQYVGWSINEAALYTIIFSFCSQSSSMASVFWVVSLMKTSIGSRNDRFDVFSKGERHILFRWADVRFKCALAMHVRQIGEKQVDMRNWYGQLLVDSLLCSWVMLWIVVHEPFWLIFMSAKYVFQILIGVSFPISVTRTNGSQMNRKSAKNRLVTEWSRQEFSGAQQGIVGASAGTDGGVGLGSGKKEEESLPLLWGNHQEAQRQPPRPLAIPEHLRWKKGSLKHTYKCQTEANVKVCDLNGKIRSGLCGRSRFCMRDLIRSSATSSLWSRILIRNLHGCWMSWKKSKMPCGLWRWLRKQHMTAAKITHFWHQTLTKLRGLRTSGWGACTSWLRRWPRRQARCRLEQETGSRKIRTIQRGSSLWWARCWMMRIGEANMKLWPWEVRAKAGGATVRSCEVLRIGCGVWGGVRGFAQYEEFWVF